MPSTLVVRPISMVYSNAISKFYASVNNILNVIGNTRNEMLAVHLATAYCYLRYCTAASRGLFNMN